MTLVGARTPTAVWRITPGVVLALAEHLGEPVDSYVNGSQTWFEDHGPGGVTLEWRLHPAPGYGTPAGLSPYEVWESVVAAVDRSPEGADLPLGEEVRSLSSVWEGLECFPAHGPEDREQPVEPAELRGRVAGILGIEPDASGLVDHDAIGAAWEASRGRTSIVTLLIDQLTP